MSRAVLRRIPLRTPPLADWSGLVHHLCFGLFVLSLTFLLARLAFPDSLFPDAGWPVGLCLVLATATTLADLRRSLPGQNVLLAAAIIAIIGAAAHLLTVLIAVPFGPLAFTDRAGPTLGLPVPWSIPFLWVVLVLNSRGVARLILRPWRKTRAYGFWLIGLTALLTLAIELTLEPYASLTRHLWFWGRIRGGVAWYSAPWINFVGWGLMTLLILAFATPSLINKKPARSGPPNYYPLIVCLLVELLFGLSAGLHQLWGAAAFTAVIAVVSSTFAVRGARW
jgi:uncharacterized membrane protein